MKFKTGLDRNQRTFFPEKISDFVPENHLARIIIAIVSKLDLSKIENKSSHIGQRGYDPEVLLSILFYGYAIGIRSSRKLSKACEDNIIFMYITSRLTPSHKTINEFRRVNLKEISDYFVEIVLIAVKLGMVNLGKIKVSIDGTKIKANASKKMTKNEKELEKLIKKTREDISKIMQEAEEIDAAEDLQFGEKRGDELPKKLQNLKNRELNIKAAMQQLQEEQKELKEKTIKKRITEGKSNKLNKEEQKRIEKKRINLTDKNANLMMTRGQGFKTGYNSQISVEEKTQFIVAADVTKEPNDREQLIPMIKLTEENLRSEINICKADGGYYSGENLSLLKTKEMSLLLDFPNKRRINNPSFKFDKMNFKYDEDKDVYVCPIGKELDLMSSKRSKKQIYKCRHFESCAFKRKCSLDKNCKKIELSKYHAEIKANRELLLSAEGVKEYASRQYTVEPVFGNIKHNKGFREFLLRGLEKVKCEFKLICSVHNIEKIAKHITENKINLDKCFA